MTCIWGQRSPEWNTHTLRSVIAIVTLHLLLWIFSPDFSSHFHSSWPTSNHQNWVWSLDLNIHTQVIDGNDVVFSRGRFCCHTCPIKSSYDCTALWWDATLMNLPGNVPSVPVDRMRWVNWISCSTEHTVNPQTRIRTRYKSHPSSLQDHRLSLCVDPLHSSLYKAVPKRVRIRDKRPFGETCQSRLGQRSKSDWYHIKKY